jgi:hypothetical protein
VQVKLDQDEYDALAVKAGDMGLSRSALVREAVRTYAMTEEQGEPSRVEALELLAIAARAGSVPAQIALERALRLAPLEVEAPPEETVEVDELTRWRRRNEAADS